LEEIRDNLEARIIEAKREGWSAKSRDSKSATAASKTNLPSSTPRSDGKTPLLNLECRRSPPSVDEPQRQPLRNSSEKLNRLFRG
jgi:hypothetical protein